jgi:hypothetical protein
MISVHRKQIIKQNITDILANINFQSMIIETSNTICHVEKFNNETETTYLWFIKGVGQYALNERDLLPRTFMLACSTINELCAWLETKREAIKKISSVNVVTNFD